MSSTAQDRPTRAAWPQLRGLLLGVAVCAGCTAWVLSGLLVLFPGVEDPALSWLVLGPVAAAFLAGWVLLVRPHLRWAAGALILGTAAALGLSFAVVLTLAAPSMST
ncbi:hypothetical protein [Nocardioides sp. 1609]|uniref:hypothetical protein n=1 Tax=Nocardioides sp. 1609 TaxID=2508327 RepID=UPI00106F6527|nr:hypothetical protein [Nocardioides sp. 1609]